MDTQREFYVWISLSHLKMKILFYHLQARKNMSTAEKTSTLMSKVGGFCKTALCHEWLSPRSLLMLGHFWKRESRKWYFLFKKLSSFLHWRIIALQLLCCVVLVPAVWQSESYIFTLSLPLTSHPKIKFHLTLVRMTSLKKSTNKSWRGCGEKETLFR